MKPALVAKGNGMAPAGQATLWAAAVVLTAVVVDVTAGCGFGGAGAG